MGIFQRHMGLDLVDTAIHVAVTVAAAVVASTAAVGPGQEGIVAVVLGVSAIVYGVRRKRALEQVPFPADTTGEQAAQALAGLEARVAELELGQQRVAELEERLDFAERLLARQAESARIPAQGGA